MSNWKPGSEVARSQFQHEQSARIINQAAYIQQLEAKLTKAREALEQSRGMIIPNNLEGFKNAYLRMSAIHRNALKALDEGSEG